MIMRIITALAVLLFTVAGSAAQQQTITTQVLRSYLDKMGLQSVIHPKNAAALVVPRSDNKNAERLDLYVEIRKERSIVLTAYPKLRGKYFSLERATDREKMLQRLLEANHRAFATFFVDAQGDIGLRFTFTTEDGLGYESFRAGVTELLRIADEYTPMLDGYMRKEEKVKTSEGKSDP